jgi:hypothetical protein
MEEELILLLLGLGAGGIIGSTNRRVIKAVAIGYVAVTEAVGSWAGPIRDNWRTAVEEARQERAQQAAQAGQSPRRARSRQRQGEKVVQGSAGVAQQAAVEGAVSAGGS